MWLRCMDDIRPDEAAWQCPVCNHKLHDTEETWCYVINKHIEGKLTLFILIHRHLSLSEKVAIKYHGLVTRWWGLCERLVATAPAGLWTFYDWWHETSLNHVKLLETRLRQIYTQVLSNMSFCCMGSSSRGGQHESKEIRSGIYMYIYIYI